MEEQNRDNINLFNKILDDNDENDDEDICLITYDTLQDNHIKLDCGHKFNYVPLYNEIVYQKTKKLLDNVYLKQNEMKCPYCRNVMKRILPFYKYYSVKDIAGVTFPAEYSLKLYECEYVRNGKKCSKSGCKTNNGILCNKHLSYKKIDEEIIKNMSHEDYKTYNKKTIKILQNELKKNNLKISGNKQELVYRLYIYNHTK
jgi:hypothetical protein